MLKFYTCVRLTNVYKRVCGIFLILFRSWVIDKPGFCECVETRSFLILANNSSSKQNKKNPEHPFVDTGKYETCAKLQQKLSESMVVGACQSFQFSRQNTCFLQNNRALSRFLYTVFHWLISITKLYKKSVHKTQFYFNHANHLKLKVV